MSNPTYISTQLRLPPDLHRELAALADRLTTEGPGRVSLNALIVAACKDYVERENRFVKDWRDRFPLVASLLEEKSDTPRKK